MSKYIDADKLIAEIEREKKHLSSRYFNERYTIIAYDIVLSFISSLQQEQPEVDLDKLVNEEFASRSQITEYGPKVIYNRAELYQLIKRMALVFNARKEE